MATTTATPSTTAADKQMIEDYLAGKYGGNPADLAALRAAYYGNAAPSTPQPSNPTIPATPTTPNGGGNSTSGPQTPPPSSTPTPNGGGSASGPQTPPSNSTPTPNGGGSTSGPQTPPPSSTPTPTPAPTSPAEPSTPTPSPPPAAAGDVINFTLRNTTGGADPAGYVTFGQVFATGAVMPSNTLVAKIGGQSVPVQMDVKTRNADGSVAHAILTLKAPALAAGASATGSLAKAGTTGSGAAIQAADVQRGLDLKVQVTIRNSDGTTTVKTIDAAQTLQQAITAGSVETWLKGTQASEYRAKANIAPNLDIVFDIRRDALGQTRTDVVFARDDAYSTNVAPITYDVKITQNGKTAFSDAGVKQHAYSTWHKQIASDGAIQPQVVYDMQYLVNTGALPAYDLSTGVNAATLSDQGAKLSKSDTGPLGNALVEKNMPGTGQSQLGSELLWTAQYINSQSATALKVMMANADAGGAAPWHFIDSNGDPVRVDQHPYLRLSEASRADSRDKLPVDLAKVDGGGWKVDTAHAPSLTFVPYLLSGDRYYIDELQAQASWHIALLNPGYRGYDQGLITESAQVRQLAWALRDIANAAYASPDADPMKGYFGKVLDNNLTKIVSDYVNGAKGDAQGALEGYINPSSSNNIAPWQQDYLATVFSLMAERGNAKASTILDWMDGFAAGRFINGANGFDPLNGAGYWIDVKNPATGKPYQTWDEVYKANYGSTHPTILAGTPDWASGYAARAKASVASIISVKQSPEAIEAYGYLQSLTTKMASSYLQEPTFDLAPELAENRYLTANEIKVQTASTATSMTAATTEALLIGNTGNDTLTGGGGGSIGLLFGMSGNDTIDSGAGKSYLFGGDGNDRLVGRAGSSANTSTMKGGGGRDVFAFIAQAHATILDFKTGDDRVELSGVSAASVKVSSSAGSTFIDLGGGGRVTLQGLTATQSSLNLSYV